LETKDFRRRELTSDQDTRHILGGGGETSRDSGNERARAVRIILCGNGPARRGP